MARFNALPFEQRDAALAGYLPEDNEDNSTTRTTWTTWTTGRRPGGVAGGAARRPPHAHARARGRGARIEHDARA